MILILALLFLAQLQMTNAFDLKYISKLIKQDQVKAPVGGGIPCVVCTLSVSVIEQLALVRNDTVGMQSFFYEFYFTNTLFLSHKHSINLVNVSLNHEKYIKKTFHFSF